MNPKKKIWNNNLQGNKIFMYFGFDFENKIKHEKNHHCSYNSIGGNIIW